MKDYMIKTGKPKIILSDHGPQFISGIWRQTLGWEGIIPVSYTHLDVYKRQVYTRKQNLQNLVLQDFYCNIL